MLLSFAGELSELSHLFLTDGEAVVRKNSSTATDSFATPNIAGESPGRASPGSCTVSFVATVLASTFFAVSTFFDVSGSVIGITKKEGRKRKGCLIDVPDQPGCVGKPPGFLHCIIYKPVRHPHSVVKTD